jgi:hypothetical protein
MPDFATTPTPALTYTGGPFKEVLERAIVCESGAIVAMANRNGLTRKWYEVVSFFRMVILFGRTTLKIDSLFQRGIYSM